ncbi:type I 3-dehydroquinase-domain-containing protein [Xylaria bambusicola]|uniref:type I 3-dehydroquinase-domain-containing protein n=1 Tax=Xylaria bambusicola TaxID=326684 RepID=UPI002007B61F|nr:type I 3-dehydroquinase-domain-containing protein [Xylaria bambusicola]KAI0508680.1 type I 3-dehydroquinase-domain-containing protein [Xylaria bambusicola]
MKNLQYGIDEAESLNNSAKTNLRLFSPDATIVLVGCRGAGKRTLGFIAAKYLGRRLLTEDYWFENSTGCNRATFLQKHGHDTFNRQTAVALARTLDSSRVHCVIECSTALLTQETRAVLSDFAETHPVIYVHRDKEDLYKLLQLPVTDAERLLVSDQKHRDFCNLEYFNLLDTSPDVQNDGESLLRSASVHSARLIHAKREFINFIDHIFGQALTRSWMQNPFSVKAIPPEHRLYTFALNLRLSTLVNLEMDLARIEAPAEAVELIIDTWPDNMLDFIATQVSLIRRKLDVPIIYHVEENPREERRRPLEERDASDYTLMMHGLRLGVDYLSLDLERSHDLVQKVFSMRGRTKIIGNYVIKGFGAPQWEDDVYYERYLHAQKLGCHIVRIARFCAGDRQDESRNKLVDRIASLPEPRPLLIAYDFSVFGQVAPFQNLCLNPTGHELLEPSSREQMVGVTTARGTIRLFFQRGWLQPLNFYVVGANVHYSASPSMFRAACEHYMLPHTYEARQCTTIEELDRFRRDPNFGGASLTAPFKVVIMDHIHHVSFHATAIGAVNTLLPLRGKTSSIIDHANARNQAGPTDKFYGDNTDWSSIATCLRRAISPRNSVQPSRTTGLIIGAGGMARAAIYALIKLGCRKIFIFNRTVAKAEAVAAHFNAYAKEHKLTCRRGDETQICHVIESAKDPWPEKYQQPTIILSCIPSYGIDDKPSVDFRMPLQWLRSPTGGVVIELAYEPLITPLVVQMRKIREDGNTSWIIIDGLEVVGEMAMEQFELYTGRNAPRRLMRRVCDETWNKQSAPFQPQRLS